MRQQQLPGHIANRPDAGHVGRHALVDLDEAALGQLDADFFQPQVLAVGAEADRQQGLLGFQGLLAFRSADLDLDTGLGRCDREHLGAGQGLDAALLELLGQFGADFFVFQRQDARQHLDHGHLGAVTTPDGGELHPDRARRR